MIWDLKTLRSLHREYLAGAYPSALAKRRKRTSAELLRAFRKHGLKVLPKKNPVMPKRVGLELILAMHADYQTGMTLAAVERKYARGRATLRNLFVSRGLPIRTPIPNAIRLHRPDGCWVAKAPATEAEIEAAIRASTKLAIPESLNLDWRKWDLPRRGEFIRRLKAHIRYEPTAPRGPHSPNVKPFDYTTPAAWSILNAANAGLPSRLWAQKMDIKSEGLIYQGQLWFWNPKMGGYMRRGNRDAGEPHWLALHRRIYAAKHGPIPGDMTVRFRDGNPNNFRLSNLYLCPKQEVCRENQAAALNRKSMERTAALLNRHHTPSKSHDLARSLSLA
jgi:hypothetical protein